MIGLTEIKVFEPIRSNNNTKLNAVIIKWGICATEVSKMTNAKSDLKIEIGKI